jgi:hypothetical protein
MDKEMQQLKVAFLEKQQEVLELQMENVRLRLKELGPILIRERMKLMEAEREVTLSQGNGADTAVPTPPPS